MKWLRWVLSLIRRLFSPKREVAEGELPPRLGKWGLPFRFITTSRGGPNFPKSQPCMGVTRAGLPHGKWVKRTRKTKSTAHYYCNVCHIDNIISLRS